MTLSKSGGKSTIKHFSSLNGLTIYEFDVVKLVKFIDYRAHFLPGYIRDASKTFSIFFASLIIASN